jgi:transcriptional regulator with XRE-family HTH domain
MPTTKDLGKAIRRLRQERGETIEATAHAAGVHPTYLGEIERGLRNPTLAKIIEIADGLGVSVTRVFASAEEGDCRTH